MTSCLKRSIDIESTGHENILTLVPVFSTFTVLLEKAKRIGWEKLVTRMVTMRNLHNIFVVENNDGK
jgi:hypothetical protein